jgi:hypothetical protein
METKEYCLISKETNICENIIIWDGDSSKWAPPSEYLIFELASIPVILWKYDDAIKDFGPITPEGELGCPGYTWDGTHLVQPKPEVIKEEPQPLTEGTQTL